MPNRTKCILLVSVVGEMRLAALRQKSPST
jgi:hypothetical protein